MKDDKDNRNMEFKEAKDQGSFAPLSITVSGENGNDQSRNESPFERIVDAPALILGGYRSYMKRIKVLASGADSLRFTFRLDEDVVAMISLSDVVFSEPQGKSDFTLDVKSLSKDYVVTDLR